MKIDKWIPGIATFRTYRREWLGTDLVAGLSIAAVALPIGIAYAQLAGFSPVVGIYSCILPAVAYAVFGSSRQLVVNPDAAACAIVAATVAPLAVGDTGRYADLSIMLTLLTGVFCIIGSLIGLGVIANFLSRPILIGYLNGIALSIIVGQMGTLFGFKVPSGGFFPTLWRVVSRLGQTNLRTLLLGVSLFLLLRLFKKLFPRLPAPLIAAVIGCVVVYFFHLGDRGVALVGQIPAGFPRPHIPRLDTSVLDPLTSGALGIVLVSFCSMMTTARGFAAKNNYRIDANQDMFALGMSDLASGLSGGFVVSGADSRTAVADASGGKSQLATIFAACAMSLVLLFLTKPLGFLPTAALAAILISSALSLFDLRTLLKYYRVGRFEFLCGLVAMVGVVGAGVLRAVVVAVALTMLNLLRQASKPRDAILGLRKGTPDVYAPVADEDVDKIPGLVIYRFDSSLLFFNADYFKSRVHEAIAADGGKTTWLLLSAESVPILDITGAEILEELRAELAQQGIRLAIARAKGLCLAMLSASGLKDKIGADLFFPAIHYGVQMFEKTQAREAAGTSDGSSVKETAGTY